MKNEERSGSVTPAESTAEAEFGKYATPLIHEAISEASALDSDEDAEVVHKLRVALRRLRTLLWAYRPLLDSDFDNQQRAIYKSLANAAGDTRNWDILIGLLKELDEAGLAQELQPNRQRAVETSRTTLSHAQVKHVLEDALSEANRELNAAGGRTSLRKFAWKRVSAAEKQLSKRMKRAATSLRSDYASFHEVRKAGKKVRYLLEFFEPLLDKKQRRGIKKLKTLQKRLGALNDVVASRELLQSDAGSVPNETTVTRALKLLKKEQKRRMKVAAKSL
jgi:CHAD domain-containing protein